MRSGGDSREVGIYQALGGLPRLSRVRLHLRSVVRALRDRAREQEDLDWTQKKLEEELAAILTAKSKDAAEKMVSEQVKVTEAAPVRRFKKRKPGWTVSNPCPQCVQRGIRCGPQIG